MLVHLELSMILLISNVIQSVSHSPVCMREPLLASLLSTHIQQVNSSSSLILSENVGVLDQFEHRDWHLNQPVVLDSSLLLPNLHSSSNVTREEAWSDGVDDLPS